MHAIEQIIKWVLFTFDISGQDNPPEKWRKLNNSSELLLHHCVGFVYRYIYESMICFSNVITNDSFTDHSTHIILKIECVNTVDTLIHIPVFTPRRVLVFFFQMGLNFLKSGHLHPTI